MRLDNLQCKAINQGGNDEKRQFFLVASNHSRDSKGNAPTDVFPHRSSWMCLRLMLIAFFLSSMVNRHSIPPFGEYGVPFSQTSVQQIQV